MKKEFLDFLNSKEVAPPHEVADQIYKKLDFKPIRPFNLTSKFLFLHFAAGVFTLAICPQFGIGPLTQGHDITHFFMGIGAWACALFCATFYFTIAQSLSLLILSNSEIRWIAQKRFSLLPSLVVATFLVLMMVGRSLTDTHHTMAFETEFQVIWVLAGLVISQAVFYFISRKVKGLSKAALR